MDHHLLGIHHVRRYGPEPAGDLGFLASGAALMLLGWLLVRRSGSGGGRTAS